MGVNTILETWMLGQNKNVWRSKMVSTIKKGTKDDDVLKEPPHLKIPEEDYKEF